MTEISLTQNKVSIIDENDAKLVSQHQWYAQKEPNGKYYAATDITHQNNRKKRIYLHRFLLQPPKGYTVVHKDGDGLNNRRENLELCKNGQTPRSRKAGSKTEYRGVYRIPSGINCYKAIITVAGKTVHIGTFDAARAAAEARDEAAFEQWGKDARLNFPENFTARKEARPSQPECEMNRRRTVLGKEE